MSRPGCTDQGYSLIELLVASLVACAFLGVLLQLASAAQRSARALADATDLQQRLRVAVDRLRRDLETAGEGPSGAAWAVPLAALVPAIVPARTGSRGADPELTYFADRISILHAPDPSAQTTVASTMAAAGAPIVIDTTASGCARDAACRLSPGDRALVVDPADSALAFDIFTVAASAGGRVLPEAPLSRAYAAGSRLMPIAERTYYLDRSGARLMLYDGNASDLPLVDHVVDLRFTYFVDLGGVMLLPAAAGMFTDGPVSGSSRRYDADLLRIRRIRVTLRLETEAPGLRASGPRFARPGWSPGGLDEVADEQVTFDVSPRSLNLSR